MAACGEGSPCPLPSTQQAITLICLSLVSLTLRVYWLFRNRQCFALFHQVSRSLLTAWFANFCVFLHLALHIALYNLIISHLLSTLFFCLLISVNLFYYTRVIWHLVHYLAISRVSHHHQPTTLSSRIWRACSTLSSQIRRASSSAPPCTQHPSEGSRPGSTTASPCPWWSPGGEWARSATVVIILTWPLVLSRSRYEKWRWRWVVLI